MWSNVKLCWILCSLHTQVTKLDRDPSSGTALQEISFWLNLERALLRIQEKRESAEITLTQEVLRHGKRFHATVSFDTDTGENHVIVSPHMNILRGLCALYFIVYFIIVIINLKSLSTNFTGVTPTVQEQYNKDPNIGDGFSEK